jgi:hypothetical protein
MRVLIALLVIAYLVGVGVALAPTIKANWSTGPASQFVESVATELPRALSWPATVYRSIAEKPLDDQNAGEHRYIGIMWADLVGGLKRRRKEFSASNVSSLSVIKSPIPLFTVNTCALIAYCEQ